jgi:hypothetical protein
VCDGESLEEYIGPVGGGLFFALPGVTGETDYPVRTPFKGRIRAGRIWCCPSAPSGANQRGSPCILRPTAFHR